MMDPVSRADRLAAILRQKLLERARAAQRAGEPRRPGDSAAVDQVGAPGRVEAEGDRARRRSLIHAILSQELGPDLINDAEFQQLVERVFSAIEQDGAAARLLSSAVKEVEEKP